MKTRNFLTVVTLMLLGAGINLQAQETISTTGGEASGDGGSASYTIGQVFYSTTEGTEGNTVAQGVQQAFEISEVGIAEEETEGISLSVLVYPNPTPDFLIVKVDNYETANLQFQVFDINGKVLQQVKCAGNKTSIDIQDYPVSNYFVKVLDKKEEIKVFKIIKN